MYYAVKKGRKPGIYRSWKECEDQVSGYPDNLHKRFNTLVEAEVFVYGRSITPSGTLENFLEDKEEGGKI